MTLASKRRNRSRTANNVPLWPWTTNNLDCFQELLTPFINNVLNLSKEISSILPMYLASLNDVELGSFGKELNSIAEKILPKKAKDDLLSGFHNPSIEEIMTLYKDSKKYRDEIFESILGQLEVLLQRKECSESTKRTLENLNRLKKTFHLNSIEESLLLYSYLMETNSNYQRFFENIYEGKSFAVIQHYAVVLNSTPSIISEYLVKESRLFKCGLMEECENFNHTIFLDPSDSVSVFLSGRGGGSFLSTVCDSPDLKKTLPLEDYSFPSMSHDICMNLLKKKGGCNILLYGEPGLGKTSYVKSLAKKLGKKLLIKKQSDKSGDKVISSLRMALNCCDSEKEILLIDEADSMLNTYFSFFGSVGDVDKGTMNELLESHQIKVIWISNQYDAINESTCRRFDYSLEFKPLNEKKREKIWLDCLSDLAKKAPIAPEDIAEHFQDYNMSPANIKAVLNTASLYSDKKGANEKSKKVAIEIFKQQVKICQTPYAASELKPAKQYNLDAVNTDTSLDSLVQSCQKYLNSRDQASYSIRNISMLFYGDPGCGKTEFAKHLAFRLGKELLLKKASDILGCYVGESEKNIARAFSEAEDDDKILFIDEADSLLQDRSGAQRSWEVTQVNELLVQMERFRGIALFATNFDKLLDKASLRRFHFKIKFSPLGKDKIFDVFKDYFPDVLKSQIEKVDESYLKQELLGVTFGDFKVVSYQLGLEQIEGTLSNLILALKHEVNSRGIKAKFGF